MAIGRTNASVGGGVSGGSQMKELIDGRQDCSYLFYKFSGTSINNIISYNDTENSKYMNSMFDSCKNLTSIPLLNTSRVINMDNMFSGCYSITTIPLLDTSNVSSAASMFSNCLNLISIPQINISNLTSLYWMFTGCKNLTSIPLLNTSKVTNMDYTFYNCKKLTSIPALDVSNVKSFNNAFYLCLNLESIEMTGMKVSFDISASTKLTREALVVILNNLATVSISPTLTMGAENLAKLTEEDKAIATNKGWTLA